MPTIKPLNETQPDFYTIADEFSAILQSKGLDAYLAGTGQTLQEFVAAMGTMLLNMLEFRANEQYTPTANLYSTFLRIAQTLGYKAQRKVGATGYVRFEWGNNQVYPASFVIPQWTELHTADGVPFTTLEDVSIPFNTNKSSPVKAVQGTRTTVSFTSTGDPGQVFTIQDTNVENNIIAVSVRTSSGNSAWTQVGAFVRPWYLSHLFTELPELKTWIQSDPNRASAIDSFVGGAPDSKIFMVDTRPNKFVQIRFGDGVFGAIPEAGSIITVDYINTLGATGNMSGVNILTEIANPPTLPAGYSLFANNEDATGQPSNFLGGAEAETIEEMRANIPRTFQTGQKADSRKDFVALLESYPGIVSANAWGEADKESPDANQMNVAKIAIVLGEYGIPDAALKRTVGKWLRERSMLTVKYDFVDPKIVPVIPTIKAWAYRGSSLTAVKNAIEAVVASQFVLGSTIGLGTPVRLSDIVDVIENVPGVDYAHVALNSATTLRNKASATSLFKTSSTGTLVTPVLANAPVVPSSFHITVGNKTVSDDGSGNLKDTEDATVGAITYATGSFGITVEGTFAANTAAAVTYQYAKSVVSEFIGYTNSTGGLSAPILVHSDFVAGTLVVTDGSGLDNAVRDWPINPESGCLYQRGIQVGTIDYATRKISVVTPNTFAHLAPISAYYLKNGTPHADGVVVGTSNSSGGFALTYGGAWPVDYKTGGLKLVCGAVELHDVPIFDNSYWWPMRGIWSKDGIEVAGSELYYLYSAPLYDCFVPNGTLPANTQIKLVYTGVNLSTDTVGPEDLGISTATGILVAPRVANLPYSNDSLTSLTDGTVVLHDGGAGEGTLRTIKNAGNEAVGSIDTATGEISINTGTFSNSVQVHGTYAYVVQVTGESVGNTSPTGTLDTGVLSHRPVVPGSVRITDGNTLVTDDGEGHLLKNGTELADSLIDYAGGTLRIGASNTFYNLHGLIVTFSYYLSALYSRKYVSTQSETLLPIRNGSVGVYVNDLLIASEDPTSYRVNNDGVVATGAFKAIPGCGYTISPDNAVKYLTGECSVIINEINPAGSDVVSFRYEQDASIDDGVSKPGDLVPDDGQIVRLIEILVTDINFTQTRNL